MHDPRKDPPGREGAGTVHIYIPATAIKSSAARQQAYGTHTQERAPLPCMLTHTHLQWLSRMAQQDSKHALKCTCLVATVRHTALHKSCAGCSLVRCMAWRKSGWRPVCSSSHFTSSMVPHLLYLHPSTYLSVHAATRSLCTPSWWKYTLNHVRCSRLSG